MTWSSSRALSNPVVSRSLDNWLARLEALDISRIELGLGRVQAVLARMGLFGQSRPLVITVAGTNGKGSSVVMLEAILRAQGYRVGAYTSPHLHHFSERIRLDGAPVDADGLVAAFEQVEAARHDTALTYFEYATLAALACFDRAGLAVILLEVGLGGRLDAVNSMDADLALITSISRDHADWLGDDIEHIAAEKAGIMRPGRPVVFSGRHCPQALHVHAGKLAAPLYRLGEGYDHSPEKGGWRFSCQHDGRSRQAVYPVPALAGLHQRDNAAGVLMALWLLHDRLPVGEAAIAAGLRDARHAGRAESFFVEGREVLLDVAHNPEGAAALAALLARRGQMNTRRLALRPMAGFMRCLRPWPTRTLRTCCRRCCPGWIIGTWPVWAGRAGWMRSSCRNGLIVLQICKFTLVKLTPWRRIITPLHVQGRAS